MSETITARSGVWKSLIEMHFTYRGGSALGAMGNIFPRQTSTWL
jgi:hypothetical protein